MSDSHIDMHDCSVLHDLVNRSPTPAYACDGYDPSCDRWDDIRILLVGAGGIGCEILHLLVVSGFSDITVIDMDKIELSNLNRQFLFQEEHIGMWKAEVAAESVKKRRPGLNIKAICGRVEDQSDDFFSSFSIIVLALDSIQARFWINEKVSSIAFWDITDSNDGNGEQYRIVEAIPIVDSGTEGYMGHCMLINMSNNETPCLYCQRDLFEAMKAKKSVPMCTLENIPRIPEHCVLYIQQKKWPDERPNETLDPDIEEHIEWIAKHARERQESFNISGPPIDSAFALGVVKNVVPAVGFINAIVAGQAVTEVIKLLTAVGPSLHNLSNYNGAAIDSGVFSQVTFSGVFHSREGLTNAGTRCELCGPIPLLYFQPEMTVKTALCIIFSKLVKLSNVEAPVGDEISMSETVTGTESFPKEANLITVSLSFMDCPVYPAAGNISNDSNSLTRKSGDVVLHHSIKSEKYGSSFDKTLRKLILEEGWNYELLCNSREERIYVRCVGIGGLQWVARAIL